MNIKFLLFLICCLLGSFLPDVSFPNTISKNLLSKVSHKGLVVNTASRVQSQKFAPKKMVKVFTLIGTASVFIEIPIILRSIMVDEVLFIPMSSPSPPLPPPLFLT